MKEIHGYHAHVYFDADTYDQAVELCDRAGATFALSVGRKHQKPVGPHPQWSCQLAFKPDLFGSVIPWLALNRNGLTVFIHLDTGNDLKDHTDHTIWMGTIEPLKLEIFK